MNAIEQLQRILSDFAPGATIRLDRPDALTGTWWLDVEWQGRSATVEWRPERGFGVSAGDGGFGEGPDQVVRDISEAAGAVTAILEQRAATKSR